MEITFTARHCDVPQNLKKRARDLLDKLAKLANRPMRASVVFDDDHQRKVVEMQLYLRRLEPKIASAEADDFRTALDRAVQKLRNQLEKDPPRAVRRVKG